MNSSVTRGREDEFFKILFQMVPTPVLEIDETLIIQQANREARRKWPSIREGKSFFYQEILSLKENPSECLLAKTFQLKESISFDQRSRGGELFHITTSYFEFNGSRRLLVSLFDITRFDKMGAALKKSEMKYTNLFQNMLEGMFQTRPDGTIIAANPALVTMLGYESEEELLDSANANELYAGESRDILMDKLEREGKLRNKEFNLKRKDGSTITVHENSRVVRDDKGATLYYEGLLTDISERRKTEQALRESEEKYRKLVERANDGITIIQEMKLRFVNSKLADLLGYTVEEMSGRPFYDFVWPENRQDLQDRYTRRIKGEIVPSIYESALKHRDGIRIDIEINAGLIQYHGLPADLVFIRDITSRKHQENERKKLQTQIQNAQKLKSLEIMAGGIAHDFNNLLTGILGNASLALSDLQENSPIYQYIKKIEKSSRAAAELTNQMLAYSGKGKFILQRIDLPKVIRDMSQLIKSTISKKVSLKFSFEENHYPIEADINQIRQVILNLILNASEAIGENPGKIEIKTGMIRAHSNYFSDAYLDRNLAEGDYLVLEISDDGPGMNDSTKSQIFDPFFTTKFKGRGLGLPAVFGIVRGHKGTIKVFSETGKGTTIKVYFPIIKDAIDMNTQKTSDKKEKANSGTTILVADDEMVVLDVASSMLESMGYKVLRAADGLECVDVFSRHKDQIALVLLDHTMPNMSGEEAFHELRRLDPQIKVILSSGYNEQEATSRFVGEGLAGFIQKPYSLDQLISKVKEVL